MAIRVFKDNLDWMYECQEHEETGCAGEWLWALEMAYGHAAMFHKPLLPMWEITVTDGKFIVNNILTFAERI